MAEVRTDPGVFPYQRFAAFRTNRIPRYAGDDRRILYLNDITGQFNLWMRPVDPVLSSQQITAFEEESVVSYDFNRTLSRIVLVSERLGTGQRKFYSLTGTDSWPMLLTPQEGVHRSWGAEILSPNSRSIAYSTDERNKRRMDLVLLNIDTLNKRYLTDDGIYTMGYFSLDGNWLTATKKVGPEHSEIHLINVSKKTKEIPWRTDEPCEVEPGLWSIDGAGFYVLSEEDLESRGLGYFDLAEQTFEWVQRLNWDIECIALSNQGSYLAWVSNEDGYSRLCVKDYERDRVYSPPLPDGVMGQPSFSQDGASLVFALSTPTRPSSLYVSDWAQNRIARPITNGFLGKLEEEELVDPNLIFFESEDGLKIPAFLYRPMMVDSALGAAPVVISIHTEPTGQSRPEYNASFQYLLNRGIGILAPNIRGSSGYGRTYESLIFGDWGGEMVEDIKQGVKYLQQLDWVDSERMGILGRHFGGYTALISTALLPEEFAAAVSIQGPCDLVEYIESLPSDLRNQALTLIGNPEVDRELLHHRSPTSHIEANDLRLLIIQGADDSLVSLSTMDKYVEDLSNRGCDVEYRVLSDVGHEFVKKRNKLSAWREAVDFLARNLLA